MSKFTAKPFLRVLEHAVWDAEDICEMARGTLIRDFEKISRTVESRGPDTIFVYLPQLCSQLDAGLDNGFISVQKGMPFTKNGFPTLFLDLYHKVFTANWVLLERPCHNAIISLRQLLKLFKKYRIDCPTSRLMEKIHEFEEIDNLLPAPRLSWGDWCLRIGNGYPNLNDLGKPYVETFRHIGGRYGEGCIELALDLSNIQYVADRVLRGFVYKEGWFRPKHGPGAVSERYKDSKYEFPTWPRRLEYKFPFSEYGIVNYTYLGFDGSEFDHDRSSPAKLIDVPKDYRGPRLIASEPISAQFVQQGLLQCVRKNVQQSILRHCIDFTSQEPSREDALSSSLTGERSTIDLSSASDRLSCALVECMFRSNFSFLELLNAARTNEILYPDGRVLPQKKFAAQGAAFTFPIQSVVYAIICIGVCFSYYGTSNLAKLARKVRVFGDDMIVPTDVYPRVVRCLEALHLKVNRSKSYSLGNFRESCGMDAFNGTDVTSASILTFFTSGNLSSLESVVECANNLYLRGFIRASSALLETIPKRILNRIPLKTSGSNAFGLIGGGQKSLPTRWNGSYHYQEVKCYTVHNVVTRTLPKGHHRLHQWFIEKPRRDSVWNPGETDDVKPVIRLRWVPGFLLGRG